jgi:hypothetical protein
MVHGSAPSPHDLQKMLLSQQVQIYIREYHFWAGAHERDGIEYGHGCWSFDWRPKLTVAVEDTPRRWNNESRRGQDPAMGSNFGKIGLSVAELWASASSMGTAVGLLIDGRNEPWRWRIRRTDGATSRGGVRPQRWVQISAKSACWLRSYGRRHRVWAR